MKKILKYTFSTVFGVFVIYAFLMFLITPEKDAEGNYIPASVVLFGE